MSRVLPAVCRQNNQSSHARTHNSLLRSTQRRRRRRSLRHCCEAVQAAAFGCAQSQLCAIFAVPPGVGRLGCDRPAAINRHCCVGAENGDYEDALFVASAARSRPPNTRSAIAQTHNSLLRTIFFAAVLLLLCSSCAAVVCDFGGARRLRQRLCDRHASTDCDDEFDDFASRTLLSVTGSSWRWRRRRRPRC